MYAQAWGTVIRDFGEFAYVLDEHAGRGEGLMAAVENRFSAVSARLARYAAAARLPHNMPSHRLRHFLFTWLKTQGGHR